MLGRVFKSEQDLDITRVVNFTSPCGRFAHCTCYYKSNGYKPVLRAYHILQHQLNKEVKLLPK